MLHFLSTWLLFVFISFVATIMWRAFVVPVAAALWDVAADWWSHRQALRQLRREIEHLKNGQL